MVRCIKIMCFSLTRLHIHYSIDAASTFGFQVTIFVANRFCNHLAHEQS